MPTPHELYYQQLLRSAHRSAETSNLELSFDRIAHANGLKFEPDYQFHPTRKWEIDRAIPDLKIGIEIQGGIYGKPVQCNHCGHMVRRRTTRGQWIAVREGLGHSTGRGIQRDYDKLNAAQLLGWILILISPAVAISGEWIPLVQEAIGLRKAITHP